ncbi:uncharacterized protein B0H18DRAFT_425258 [Fomitopsis serialis]|uniref:uncharacterized protein n=1 Tax=Fomitopsis serialis TaxID=139415 RepID=UPI0020076033|nr:uncharacterized protein B0H18DRAFT_425258 [Neoantrodia serialis]KAH9924540.1 hypothetical protein B0H18DRAFT_425258 [Neoantrodia serialis]
MTLGIIHRDRRMDCVSTSSSKVSAPGPSAPVSHTRPDRTSSTGRQAPPTTAIGTTCAAHRTRCAGPTLRNVLARTEPECRPRPALDFSPVPSSPDVRD